MGQSNSSFSSEDQIDSLSSLPPAKYVASAEHTAEGKSDTSHEDHNQKDDCSETSQDNTVVIIYKKSDDFRSERLQFDSEPIIKQSFAAMNFKQSVTDYSRELEEQTVITNKEKLSDMAAHDLQKTKSLMRLTTRVLPCINESQHHEWVNVLPKFQMGVKPMPKEIGDSFLDGRESLLQATNVNDFMSSFTKQFRVESLVSSSSCLEFDAARMN